MISLPATFLVSAQENKQRLDHFLTNALAGAHSRSQVAEFVKDGLVTVNGHVITKPSLPIQQGQTIAVIIPQPRLFPLTPQKIEFEVIAEEKDFLVINKPAGLMVHHASSAPEAATLVQGLLYKYPDFSNFESNERPGIVHRLDKDTSGLILVARTPQALTALAQLFKSRSLEKKYHALVSGWTPRQGTIDLPIGRHPHTRTSMSINGIAARSAITHYKALSYYENDITLLECTIVTGRTHQIRVHCAHEKFPVLGDAVYGTASPLIGRQALHAYALTFEYRGTRYSYTAPYPADFASAIKNLKEEPSDS